MKVVTLRAKTFIQISSSPNPGRGNGGANFEMGGWGRFWAREQILTGGGCGQVLALEQILRGGAAAPPGANFEGAA